MKSVKKLISELLKNKDDMDVRAFIMKNRRLVMRIDPYYKKLFTMIERCEKSSFNPQDASDCIKKSISDLLDLTCAEFILESADLKIPEHYLDLSNKKILQKIDQMQIFDSEKKNIFKNFVGYLHCLMNVLEDLTNIQNQEDIKTVLSKAVEYMKTDVNLWLQLSRLEMLHGNWSKANAILNEAIEHAPDSVMLWMRLALSSYNVQDTVDLALISFANNGFEIRRREWIDTAIEEQKQFHKNSKLLEAVLDSVLGVSLENGEDIKDLISSDLSSSGDLILKKFWRSFSSRECFWMFAMFHENSGFHKFLVEKNKYILDFACRDHPHDSNLRHLIQAILKWSSEQFAAAKRYFDRASSDIKMKRLYKNGLERFRVQCEIRRAERHKNCMSIINIDNAKMYVKSEAECLKLKQKLEDEWVLSNTKFVKRMLEKLVIIYPSYIDFWLMKAQIETKNCEYDVAESTFKSAIDLNSFQYELTLYLSQLEEKRGNFMLAKDHLEIERKEKREEIQLWIASIRLELRVNNIYEAKNLLYQAMEKFPRSGELWAELISMEILNEREKKIAEAFKICGDDINIILAASKYFFCQGKVKKSRKWFNKAIEINPDFGDAWGYYYKLEKIWGTEHQEEHVLIGCIQADPCQGTEWMAFRKEIDNWTLTAEELLELFAKMCVVR